MADPQFIVQNNEVTLNLPEGLSLAVTAEPQSLEYTLADLPGGAFDYTSWIIRGDKEGEYDITADYSGVLMPFEALLQTIFKTTEPLKVVGSKGLKIYVYPPEFTKPGDPYDVEFALVNESDIPLYNINASFGAASNRRTDSPIKLQDPVTGIQTVLNNIPKIYSLSSLDKLSSIPYLLEGDGIRLTALNPGQALTTVLRTTVPYAQNLDELKDIILLQLRNAFSNTQIGSTVEIEVIIGPIPDNLRGGTGNFSRYSWRV